MSDQIDMLDRFCVYGVAADYAELVRLMRCRVDELKTTHEAIDAVSGLQSGYASKIMASIKSLGRVSMGPMLDTLGLALIVVRDDERFAAIRHRLAQRERPKPPIGSSARPKWLITPKKALKMNARRKELLSPKRRQQIARKAGKASARARRRARMEAAE